MKYYYITDIHGAFAAMMQALEEIGYDGGNSDHQLIVGGDYFGRANDIYGGSKAIFEYLTSPTAHINKPICIRGNHESILMDTFRRGHLSHLDIRNGEHKTIASFAGVTAEQACYDDEAVRIADKAIRRWIEDMPWYFETKNTIFTHGWLPGDTDDYDKLSQFNALDWHKATWSNTYDEVVMWLHYLPNGYKKTLCVGHWHAEQFWEMFENQEDVWGEPYHCKELNVWFCDCCTAMGYGMRAIMIEDEPMDANLQNSKNCVIM